VKTSRNSGPRTSVKPRVDFTPGPTRTRLAGNGGSENRIRLDSPLNERPGYLLWRARHIADSIFTHECREFSFTSSQYVVLAVVKETPGTDQIGVSRIAGLDRFTTALVLSNLIKRKLVIQERSTSDRRRYSLRLTPRGLEFLKFVLPGATRARARLLSPFTQRERRVFIRMLQKLVTALNSDARAPVHEGALPHTRRRLSRIAKT